MTIVLVEIDQKVGLGVQTLPHQRLILLMKSVMSLIFIVATVVATPLTRGLLEGAQLSSIIKEASLEYCLNPEMENFFENYQSLLSQQSARDALHSLAQALTIFTDAIRDCADLDALAQQLKSAADLLTHPIVLTDDFNVNGLDFHEYAIGSAKENDVYDAAIGVGVMLKETLRLKNRSSQALAASTTVLIEIYSGFVRGFYEEGGIHIEDVQACFSSATGAVSDFIGAVQLIASRDPKYVKEGLRLLGMGLQILPSAIRECKKADEELQDFSKVLEEAIALLENPSTFAFEIGRHLIVNGKDIIKETTTAVQDWNQENYSDFGYQLGRISYQLIVGDVIIRE